MKQTISLCLAFLTLTILATMKLHSHPNDHSALHSQPGSNIWNQAQEPTNWWNEIKSAHGHVGPWNVLGWRMGKAALRELGATWGQHELDVVCHIPLKTPYSCIADGLVVGTGNSIGRLDLRLAEEISASEIHVSVCRKDGFGPVLVFKPSQQYLEKIRHAPDAQLETLARECGTLSETELFLMQKVLSSPSHTK